MFLLKECQRLLQLPARELLEAPVMRDESFRPVNAIVLEESTEQAREPASEGAAQPDFAEDDMEADDCNADGGTEPSDESCEEETSNSTAVDNSDAQPVAEYRTDHEEINAKETTRTTGLMQTTCAHDDWLHRGPSSTN